MKSFNELEEVKNNFIHSQSIEEKLEEAEKDYKQCKVYSEEEVWAMFSKKIWN